MDIRIDSVNKSFGQGDGKIDVLKDVSCTIDESEICMIVGASGSGKSTLLNCLGGLDRPDSGTILVGDREITSLSRKDLGRYRRDLVGFVFQFYNLVPNLTALENVELAAEIVPHAMDPAQALAAVGLSHRLDNFPAQLSGGEQQRVSIARALAKKPKLLLCDEPTGALDYQTGKQVLQILQDMSRQEGATVIIVTHNGALAPIADRVIRLHDAQIQSITVNDQPQHIGDLEY